MDESVIRDFVNDKLLEQELLEKFNIKLTHNEAVLFKYRCCLKQDCYLEIFLNVCIFLAILIMIVTFLRDVNLNSTRNAIALILGIAGAFFPIYLISLFLDNLKHQGFYVTTKRLIAFNGVSFSLHNIHLRTSGRKLRADDLHFCNYKKHILFVNLRESGEKEKELNRFLSILHEISGNDELLNITYRTYGKLMKKSEFKKKIK